MNVPTCISVRLCISRVQLVVDETKSTKDHGHKFEKQIKEAVLGGSFLSRKEGKLVARAPLQVVLRNFMG